MRRSKIIKFRVSDDEIREIEEKVKTEGFPEVRSFVLFICRNFEIEAKKK